MGEEHTAIRALTEASALTYIVSVVMIILGFLAARTLKKIDANQARLFEKYDGHETRLSKLEGEHTILARCHLVTRKTDEIHDNGS